MIVEFLEQARDGVPFHLLLVERLDGGEARAERDGNGWVIAGPSARGACVTLTGS